MERLALLLFLAGCGVAGGTSDPLDPANTPTTTRPLECEGVGPVYRPESMEEQADFLAGRWVTCATSEYPLFAHKHGEPDATVADGVEFIRTSTTPAGTWRLLARSATGYTPLFGVHAEGDWAFHPGQLNITYATGSYNPTHVGLESQPDAVHFEFFIGTFHLARMAP